jgi:hypothetical protein
VRQTLFINFSLCALETREVYHLTMWVSCAASFNTLVNMSVAHYPDLQRRYCSSLLVYLLLLSLLLPLIARSLALLPTGYINLEYLFIGVFSVFLRRRIAFALLVLDSLVDFGYRIALTYNLSLNDLLDSLRSLKSLPPGRILELSAVFVLILVACALAAHARPRPEDRSAVAGSLIFLIVFFASAASRSGQTLFKRADLSPAHGSLVRVPTVSFARLESFLHAVDLTSHKTVSGGMNSASSHAIAFLDSPGAVKSPNVVLIVVESWGNPLDAHLAKAIDAAYDDPRVAEKYDVSHGSVAFRGGTISAEARELCQSAMGFNILVAPPESLLGCLPAVLHARNYQNLSIHGYVGSMFQRNTWYPKIGFDRSWFKPDLNKLKLPDCGEAFPGTCDAAIAGWIGNSLLSEDTGKPQFIYWVTLNSHLPVPTHPNLAEDGVCSTLPSLRDSVPLCSWFRLVRNVHQSVQEMALRPTARPTVFVLVGDHAPPFADPKLRQIFSATDVPYLTLTPRIAVSR